MRRTLKGKNLILFQSKTCKNFFMIITKYQRHAKGYIEVLETFLFQEDNKIPSKLKPKGV